MSSLPVRFARAFVIVLVWLAAVAGLLAPSAVADPVDCDALVAQIEAHNQAAAVHNANSPNPSDQAAVAAYNAEAERGNAEAAQLDAQAQQCRSQGHDVPQVGGAPPPNTPNPAPGPAPSPAPKVPAPPVLPPSGGAPGLKASPAAPAAPVVGQPFPVPVRPSQILSPPTIRPGTAYNPATAAGATLKAPSPLPGSVASNPRFTPAPNEPMQAPGLNTPPGQPGMTSTQQEFFGSAPRLLDVAKAVPTPSNSGNGQIYRLPDLTGTGTISNSGPALYTGPGNTRAIAGPLDPLGRPTGSYGYLDAAGAKSPRTGVPTIDIRGATGAYQRGHLWPNQYGGPGNVRQFLAPELGTTNTGAMRVYERYLGQVVQGQVAGVPAQNVTYIKVPIYTDDKVIPDYYLLQAWGDQGWNLPPTYVQNF
ncbi:hypothetical protein J2W56_006714 [Nocardia kruczakiae]|uniref:Type VII secretion system protein EssD-like domain-containing protein n=1 Tax=Nocardia kruczakiae TaxID=261477 RepID=A0ABU1XQV3_9NOCA|nr:hypothetical protein [Nocardia kruczakiae]MDR7172948.1 hypothetical protein [Nocardia kruczakiae]